MYIAQGAHVLLCYLLQNPAAPPARVLRQIKPKLPLNFSLYEPRSLTLILERPKIRSKDPPSKPSSLKSIDREAFSNTELATNPDPLALQYRSHSAHLKLQSSRARTTSRTIFGLRLSSRFATQRQQQSRALMAPNTREPVRFVSFVVHKPYSRRSPKSLVSVHLGKSFDKGFTKFGGKKQPTVYSVLSCCGQFLYYSRHVLDTISTNLDT